MATVTGFTAERMLVIENETVIDGEVRVDNLILQRRDGVEIDAGNVRGPKGDKGDTGAPGVVQSVNDVSTPALYAPRIFTTKADLDAWTTAPVGSMGVVGDVSSGIWQKDSTGWFLVSGIRIFADITERDTRWPNPPDGTYCEAPPGTRFVRVAGVWNLDPPWSAPRGVVAEMRDMPASDVIGTNPTGPSFNIPMKANRIYRITLTMRGSTGTTAGSSLRFIGPNYPSDWAPYQMVLEKNQAANEAFSGGGTTFYRATADGNKSWSINMVGGAGSKILAKSCSGMAEDIGGF